MTTYRKICIEAGNTIRFDVSNRYMETDDGCITIAMSCTVITRSNSSIKLHLLMMAG